MALSGGAAAWHLPDGYLLAKASGGLKVHDSLMMLDVNDVSADVKVDFYFKDKDPLEDA